MSELRFDGRVAVITGAGRGLGRAYAELLAARGAKVVVNDTGGTPYGEGADVSPAEEVVQAIKAAGGHAVVNADSVATPEGGKAIVDTAIKNFGRLDILIHNAGIRSYGLLKDISYEDFKRGLDVHLFGAFNVLRAGLPIMSAAKYGRVVLTSSVASYGRPDHASYSVGKSAMIGLSNTLAMEGEADNIKSNIILPGAVTRLAQGRDVSAYPPMLPEMVAPVVGWLCHETCSVSGEILISMAGRVARAVIAEAPGLYKPTWTVEDVAANLGKINDLNGYYIAKGHDRMEDHIRYSFEMAKAGGAGGKK